MEELPSKGWLNKKDRFCLLCGSTAKGKVSKHRNSDMPVNFQFHSRCAQEKVYRDGSPIDVLRMMNIPFIREFWEYALGVEEDNVQRAFSKYLQIMGPKSQFATFLDGEFTTEPDEVEEEFEADEEMVMNFGPNLEEDDYIELKNNLDELYNLQKPRTQLEKSKYIDTAWLKRLVRRALKEGNSPSDIEKLQKAYQNSLKDLGLDSVALSEVSQTKTVSQRIKDWEEEGPTPEIGSDFKDVDGVMNLFRKGFVTPVLRNFGLATDEMLDELGGLSKDDIPGDVDD